MPVVIEELQAEVAATRPPSPAPEAGQGAANTAFDERPVREMLERESQRHARLHAD